MFEKNIKLLVFFKLSSLFKKIYPLYTQIMSYISILFRFEIAAYISYLLTDGIFFIHSKAMNFFFSRVINYCDVNQLFKRDWRSYIHYIHTEIWNIFPYISRSRIYLITVLWAFTSMVYFQELFMFLYSDIIFLFLLWNVWKLLFSLIWIVHGDCLI